MWLGQVLRYQVPSSFANLLFLSYHTNATTTTGSCWFHDIHVLIVAHFSFVAPTFVVLWEKIGGGTYLEIFAVSSPLALNISPKVTFMTDVPCSCKMIDLLKLIHIPKLPRTDESSPQAVPRPTVCKSESCQLERINNAIIGMSWIIYSECQSWVRFQIFLRELLDSILSKSSLNFKEGWIIEKDWRLAAWNWSISTSYYVVWRTT